MRKSSKYLTFFAFSLIVFGHQQTVALQPVADLHLANLTGEESPLTLEPQNFEQTIYAHNNFTVSNKESQPISLMEQYIQDSLLNNLNEPLLLAIENKYIISQRKNDYIITTLHSTAESNFGLEPFSITWYGNYQDIVKVEDINYISFNSQSGQYEFNNVRGRAYVSAQSHTNDNRQILLTKAPVPLQ